MAVDAAAEADRAAQNKEAERIVAEIPERMADAYRKGLSLIVVHYFDGSEYHGGLPQNRKMKVDRLRGSSKGGISVA